ncbi:MULTISPECIES: DUF3263 domain-containing protein [unclassified Micromonospora]|uniref:DUF3263 domain-containing protein n=1 Tax=unclassified Micromonospora TaxID=2617518 RepID=UPI0022BB2AE1|nr:DUF3263 domain-containing protein [Micromonospora sp. AKA38]GHJ12737.1 hypothetical protein TPA0908_07320 [Micromonospora sp. AKA38]
MSADATDRTAAERSDPPPPVGGTRAAPGAAVPPPRTAPPVESVPPAESVPPDEPAPSVEPEPAPSVESAGLTERELRILAFESRWWKHAGAKEQAIRDTFGLSATRYYQLLNGLLDHPAALAAEPVLIGRLRRLRSSRARNRRR